MRRIVLVVLAVGSIGVGVTAVLVGGGSGRSSCSDVWTGASGDHAWGTRANWSTGSVPRRSDRVCAAAGTLIVATHVIARVASLEDQGSLVLGSGALLDVADRTPPSTVAELTLQSGILTGVGEVDITDTLDWMGHGAMLGRGLTVLGRKSIAALSFADGSPGFLAERRLRMLGMAEFSHGALYGIAGASIFLNGTFDLNAQMDQSGPGGLLDGRKPGSPRPQLSYP